jgi:parvulin-like peptidyl-prolyl isomerase
VHLTLPARRSVFAIPAKTRFLISWLTLGILGIAISQAYGIQQSDSGEDFPNEIIATVNGQTITRDQIARDLKRTLGDRQLSSIEKEKAIELTTQKLINQQIAIDFLTKRGLAANSSEVDFQIENLKSELKTIDLSFTEFLKETYQTSDELAFQTKWQISWNRYLENKLSDSFLESYFKRNKRRFDGTEIKAAHLLLKTNAHSSPEQEQRLENQLIEIRNRFIARTLSWQEGVAEYSEAPTRSSGGSIGWINAQGPMPATFTEAAFQLSKNDISLPVKTKFGFHLIRCEATRNSSLGWKDVRSKLKKNAARDLLDAIVEQHKPNVTIKQ